MQQTKPVQKETDHTGPLMRPIILLIARVFAVIYLLSFAYWYGTAHGLQDANGKPLGADFINVYAAGTLALHGHAPAIYDWALHAQAERSILGYDAPYYAWHYPPFFLALAALLALVPYLWAFALYMLAGFAAYMAVLRRLLPRGRAYIWGLAAFPGAFDNLINGQNAFITAALLGSGALWLNTSPWLAGCMFGLLSYKPQFFAVIPLALAVGRYGRALLACVATSFAAMILSWAVFGSDTWQAFFASTRLTRGIILEQGSTGWQKIQSVFAWARMWGCDIGTAYIVQGVMALAALLAMGYVWRGKTSTALRMAALTAAILLTTPYLLDYDLVILAVPIAMLTRQGVETGFYAYEKILLGCLWFLPMIARQFGAYGVPTTPVLMIALMAFCVSRASPAAAAPR